MFVIDLLLPDLRVKPNNHRVSRNDLNTDTYLCYLKLIYHVIGQQYNFTDLMACDQMHFLFIEDIHVYRKSAPRP